MMRRGFTLVELIVVIAIIAILAAVIAPNAFKAIEKAKVSAVMGNWRTVKTATIGYYTDIQAWPATCTAVPCNAGLVNNDGARGWDGPYVEKWPSKSPWGAGVVYYRNDANVNWDNSGVGDSARYFEIQIVPQASAQKIDDNIDGAVAGGSGAVRYSAAATTSVYILIQTDVALN